MRTGEVKGNFNRRKGTGDEDNKQDLYLFITSTVYVQAATSNLLVFDKIGKWNEHARQMHACAAMAMAGNGNGNYLVGSMRSHLYLC
jgi:hypothetical protein